MEWPASEDEDERYVSLLPCSRTLAAFDGSRIVGTSGTFALDFSIPGARVPVAALTMVTVAQTHRRQGILRGMMNAHVDAAEQRGDALSALWASEAPIYGRFGYGVAAEYDAIEIDTRGLAIHGAEDALTLVESNDASVVQVYEQLFPERAGLISRNETWWRERHFRDPAFRRHGASAKRYIVASRQGVPTGYLAYRQKPKMEHGIADGTVEVVELFAADAAAAASLWQYACSIDLHPHVSAWNVPVDSPLPWLCADRRRVRRHRTDSIWIRLCDVEAALTARRYEADGEVTFGVVDPMERVTGTYRLRVSGGVGACERIDSAAELTLKLADLGSLYLGGFRARELVRAGAIAAGGAADRLDRMFETARAPWCAEIF